MYSFEYFRFISVISVFSCSAPLLFSYCSSFKFLALNVIRLNTSKFLNIFWFCFLLAPFKVDIFWSCLFSSKYSLLILRYIFLSYIKGFSNFSIYHQICPFRFYVNFVILSVFVASLQIRLPSKQPKTIGIVSLRNYRLFLVFKGCMFYILLFNLKIFVLLDHYNLS